MARIVGSFLEFWRANDTFIGIFGYKGTKTVLMDMQLMYN